VNPAANAGEDDRERQQRLSRKSRAALGASKRISVVGPTGLGVERQKELLRGI
jgi:hypothetical protein